MASHSTIPRAVTAAAIRDNLLFADMPPAALEIIVDAMHSVSVPAGTDIIRQVCFTIWVSQPRVCVTAVCV